jgi:hypothetical protein
VDLIKCILQSLEDEFGAIAPTRGIVQKILQLIYASRSGLTDDDIFSILQVVATVRQTMLRNNITN